MGKLLAGKVVNMASTGGLRGLPGLGAYAASKHGVIEVASLVLWLCCDAGFITGATITIDGGRLAGGA